MLLKGIVGHKCPKFNKNNSFRLSAWVSPIPETYNDYKGPKFITNKGYKDVRKSGLTSIYALYEQGNLSETIDAIKYAKNNNVKYYVRDKNLNIENLDKNSLLNNEYINSYKDLEGYYGHLIIDEPNVNLFTKLKSLKDIYEEIFPNKDFYINLLPTNAAKELLGTETYEEYIDKYIEILQPKYISVDHYAIMADRATMDPYLTDDVLYNYEVISDRCRKYNIDMFTFVADMRYNVFSRLISEKDLRWQVNSQLAYGSRGIQYFCYWKPIEFVHPLISDAMMSVDGKKTDMYYYVQKMNKDLKKLAPAFLAYRHMGTMHINGTNSKKVNPAFLRCKNAITSHNVLEKVTSTEDAIIGCFENENHECAFFIMNYTDTTENKDCSLNIKFNSAKSFAIYYNKKCIVKKLSKNFYKFDVKSGEGIFVIPLD